MPDNPAEPSQDRDLSDRSPMVIYPQPTAGPLANSALAKPIEKPEDKTTVSEMPHSGVNGWSAALLVLLLLTFFTPLGSILFLPIVVVGVISAGKYVQAHTVTKDGVTTRSGLANLVRAVALVVSVIGISLMVLIGLVFIAFATGIFKLDFGS